MLRDTTARNKIRLAAVALGSATPAAVAWVVESRPITLAAALAIGMAVLVGYLAFASTAFIFRRVGVVVAALALLCFGATMAEEFLLGGTPLNGVVNQDGYFVGSHGQYHEVSPLTYHVAMVFDVGLVALWPAMFVFAILNDRLGRRQRQHRQASDQTPE